MNCSISIRPSTKKSVKFSDNSAKRVPSFDKLTTQMKINFKRTGLPIDDTSGVKVLFFTLLLILVLESAGISGFLFGRMSSDNLLELSLLIPCNVQAWLCVVKMWWFYDKRDKTKQLCDSVKSIYNIMLNGPELLHVESAIWNLLTLIKYHFILNLLAVFLLNIMQLLLSAINYYFVTYEWHVHLPYEVLFPFPMDSAFVHTALYCFGATAGFIGALVFTEADEIYFILTSLVYMYFKILCKDIENLNPEESDKLLNGIIKKHQFLIKLSCDLEEIFTGPIFIDFLTGSLVICCLVYHLMFGPWSAVLPSLLCLSSILLRIFLISVFGQELVQQSTQIGDSVYFCKWYDMDRNSRRKIIIIRERALRPQYLTAFKFTKISYLSFSRIISTSWSYFTILKTVCKPSE